jgi:hypothetical protein
MAATNQGDEDGEAMLAMFFDQQPGRQYARRMWVPANSRRYDWIPFFLPNAIISGRGQVGVRTSRLEVANGRELLQRRQGETLAEEMLMAIDTEPVKTAAYYRKPPLGAETATELYLDDDVAATMGLARTSSGLSVNVTQIELDFLPPWAEVLRMYDNMVLTADRIQNDAAGQAAIRGWLRGGGRLWITLDRVAPETVALLLGNAVDLQVIDRVPLDRYTLVSRDPSSGATVEEACEYEEPVDLVRVVTSATDVPSRIDGWPAAVRVPYGEGEVLITTLAPRGWRAEFQPQPTQALKTMMFRFFQVRDGRPNPRVFQSALEQQIGYSVPSRGVATVILAAYCAALLAAGLWLFRHNRLDRLAWVVPAVTVPAAVLFVIMGVANSTGVPPTLTHAQLVSHIPQSNEARVEGLAAIYDPQSREVDWKGVERTWLLPDPADDANIRRLVWTDVDGMETQNASVKAGSVGLASELAVRPLRSHVGVRGRFGASGFEGRFEPGELRQVGDFALLNPAASAMAVKVDGEGRFRASPNDVLAADEYSGESLLSDEQRRRQGVMRRLFDPADSLTFPSGPSLAFWSQSLVEGSIFPAGYETRSTALNVLPLEIERTDPGQPFEVPPPFLRVAAIPGRSGISTAYDTRTGKWVRELTRASEIALRFQLPDQVLPARLERGLITLRGNVPSRTVGVWEFGGKAPRKIRDYPNVNGVVECPLEAADLTLDAQGGVRLMFTVSGVNGDLDEGAPRAGLGSGMPLPPGTPGVPGMPGAVGGPRVGRPPTGPPGGPPMFPPDGGEPSAADSAETSVWQFEYVRLSVAGQTLAVDEPAGPGPATR